MHSHVPDRLTLVEAEKLIERFGVHAGAEASVRADRSRALGNVIHFCHWRQVERTIALLSDHDVTGTVH